MKEIVFMAKFNPAGLVILSLLVLLTYPHAQPNRVDIAIVSQQMVAGDTIVAAILISDQNGLIPGTFCAPVIYQDILNSLPSQPHPSIIVGGNAYMLNHNPDTSISINQCFSNGIDTIKIILFNAPYSGDSPHQLFIRMGQIKDSTTLFKVSPSEINRIRMRGFGGESAPDTVSLLASVAQYILSAVGYDAYGNNIGLVFSNWSMTGSLPKFEEDSAQLISVFFGDAQTPAEGYLIAKSVLDSSISDSVWIELNNPTIAKNTPLYPESHSAIQLISHDDIMSIDIAGIPPLYSRISLHDLSGKTLYSAILSMNHVDIKPALSSPNQLLVLSIAWGNTRVESHPVFLVDRFKRDAFARRAH